MSHGPVGPGRRRVRVLSSVVSMLVVVAGAVVVVGMAQGRSTPSDASATRSVTASASSGADSDTGFTQVADPDPATSQAPAAPDDPSSSAPITAIAPATTAAPAPTTDPTPASRPVVVQQAPVAAPRTTVVVVPVQTGRALPLGYSTGSATQVVTVTASSRGSTTATVQAWNKAPGGGWLPFGSAIFAYIGSQGMTTSPSESLSATPMGSFTLTQAFGALGNPGTRLPYRQTNPSDWWISQFGGSYTSIYNTFQSCSSGCPFNTSNSGPNEHLYYETPDYNYAVVIDYNTKNAPGGVQQGAGSAFFFHVSTGSATAGCVAIPQSRLITIMQWLNPAANPRILIGTD